MSRLSPWKRHKRLKRATGFNPKLVHSTPKPIDILLAEMRKGIDPGMLAQVHIPGIVRQGSKRHAKFLEFYLRRYPERKNEPYPFYNDVRNALLEGIKKLREKEN